jgi:hypothetical protein
LVGLKESDELLAGGCGGTAVDFGQLATGKDGVVRVNDQKFAGHGVGMISLGMVLTKYGASGMMHDLLRSGAHLFLS